MKNKEDNHKPVALLDMDGTIIDYDTAMQRDLDAMRSPNEPRYTIGLQKKHPPYIVARMDLIKSRGEWWENLPRFKLGFDVLGLLKELDFYVSILTQGPKGLPIAWSHKVSWAIKNVPELDITITRRKGLVYGRVLVDDYIPYVEQWLEFRPRGLVIMPVHEWNKDYVHPNVLKYDGTDLKQIKKALIRARDRKQGEPLDLQGIWQVCKWNPKMGPAGKIT